MKKILPLLIAGFLIFSGLGAIGIANENSYANTSAFQPEVVVEARGGFGVIVTVTNNGNMSIENVGNITVTIRATIMLRGGYSILNIPIPIPAGGSASVGTGFVLGLGHCMVNVTIDIDGDSVIDGKASNSGLIFLPLVLVNKFMIPLP